MSTVFETEVCSRCGGSGQFSFNGEHSRCYKCDGKNSGNALTKRGAAAKAWFDAKMTVAIEDVKVGDVIRTDRIKQLTVATIEERDCGAIRSTVGDVVTERRIIQIVLRNKDGLTASIGKGGTVRRVLSQEGLDALRAEAVAYQSTLTKSGTPRKRG